MRCSADDRAPEQLELVAHEVQRLVGVDTGERRLRAGVQRHARVTWQARGGGGSSTRSWKRTSMSPDATSNSTNPVTRYRWPARCDTRRR